jgi:hypothetical protein
MANYRQYGGTPEALVKRLQAALARWAVEHGRQDLQL